jgi:hypothetical protein
MPAINLARLKHQSARLVDLLDQPLEFIHELHALLDFYADRTHRPGQSGEPPPLLQSYKVPKPVLRQIIIELSEQVKWDLDRSLRLVDALWEEPYLEIRTLAAMILGIIPPDPPESILNKVQIWVTPKIDQQLINTVLDYGLVNLRSENPDVLLRQIDRWLSNPDEFYKLVGLRALIPLISSPDYDNLPILFQLLSPFARKAPLNLRPDVVGTFRSLALRSPKETAYFLHQNLEAPENPDTAMLIRQCLPSFPQDLQEALRFALRETTAEKR